MKSDTELLYLRCKDIALEWTHDSKGMLAFIGEQNRGLVLHHVFGSVHGRRSSDLCVVALDPVEHLEKHDDREFLAWQIPQMLRNLMLYTKELERRLDVR